MGGYGAAAGILTDAAAALHRTYSVSAHCTQRCRPQRTLPHSADVAPLVHVTALKTASSTSEAVSCVEAGAIVVQLLQASPAVCQQPTCDSHHCMNIVLQRTPLINAFQRTLQESLSLEA